MEKNNDCNYNPSLEEKKNALGQIRDELIRMKRAYIIHKFYCENGLPYYMKILPYIIEVKYDDNLYAFFVHIRAFDNFFTYTKRMKNEKDMLVRDYVSFHNIKEEEYYIKNIRPKIKQINSYISHLDYERVIGDKLEEKKYELNDFKIVNILYIYFMTLVEEFVNELDDLKYKKEKIELKKALIS